MLYIDNARGKKIIRLVRRVSGLLMQLTVFELPSNVADAAYNITKAQLTATATVAADEEVKKVVSSRPPSSAEVLPSSELEAGSSMTIHEAPDESSEPVSYTHLTLPTICSV